VSRRPDYVISTAGLGLIEPVTEVVVESVDGFGYLDVLALAGAARKSTDGCLADHEVLFAEYIFYGRGAALGIAFAFSRHEQSRAKLAPSQ
jgi:hypothetical protein